MSIYHEKQNVVNYYGGGLPYATSPAIYTLDNQQDVAEIFFLIGQEHQEMGWQDASKWADFGGGVNVREGSGPYQNRDIRMGAAREIYEETMGFFGSIEEVERRLDDQSKLQLGRNVMFLFRVHWDQELPIFMKRVYNYMMKCGRPHPQKQGMQYIPSCPEGFTEKVGFIWISWTQLKQQIESEKNKNQSKLFRDHFIYFMDQFFKTHRNINGNIVRI